MESFEIDLSNEIRKIIAYRYCGSAIYILEYMDGRTEEINEEYFYHGHIISEAVKYRTVIVHEAHNGGWNEYINPKYYAFPDI